MPSASRAPVLRAAGAALAVVAAVVLAPGRASAECGDYVHIAGQPTADHRVAAELPAPAPKPCDGPSCSGHPAPPVPLTAPAGESSRGHEVAALAPADPAPAGGRGRPRPGPTTGRPVHVPQPVFHPPRGW